jgi:hypothetical protein
MSQSHVVSGLLAKHSELSGLIDHHMQEIKRMDADLRHLGATIKLFAPEIDLRTVRSKAHRERNQYFMPGERPKMILDILRRSGSTLTSRQIAEAMLKRKHLEHSAEMINEFQKNALGALKKLEIKGLIMQGNPDGTARTWKLA